MKYLFIEFYFLKCTEKNLQQQLKFFIDDPKFNSTQNNLEQLITTIKKYNYENDENKMLSCVLHEYIPAEALLSFVHSLGIKRGEGADIFGENIEKKGLEENNVIEVIGKTIKAIRNGIVHSSDKYNRADRFIPFSESETTVKKSLGIFLIGVALFLMGTLIISITDPDFSLLEVGFEVVSAIATVGLSIGGSPNLSILGKIFIMLFMFMGRVGSLYK